MSAPAAVRVDRPTVRIRGTAYPVLLPTVRDPRLHLAAVIVSLQVLGQVAFDFQLSIAQILVSLAVAGILEVAIAFRSQRVLMWPASALLTGNGVAFVLRVPGTEHGDWWSMNGWWIFAGTSAIALLSKYLIRVRGRHIFNPSNFGLVLCFLLLGAERADPLALWWGPLSPALVVAIGLIVAGGFLILRRLHLVGIAVGFWLAFAAGIGVLAASGHTMTAAWHVGPIEGAEFWWLLVSSPEILVFLFFMITDPKTIPASRGGRRVYAIGVGLLATLLIAPQTTEFGTKVAILAALFVACTAQGVVALVGLERLGGLFEVRPTRRVVAAAALTGALAYGAVVVAAGIPARPDAGSASAAIVEMDALPEITVADSEGVAGINAQTAQTIARDVLVDLHAESEALRARDLEGARKTASGAWLAALWDRIRGSAGGPIAVPSYQVEHMELSLRRGAYQGPPTVVADLEGTVVVSTHGESTRQIVARADPQSFRRTLELVLEGQRYLIVGSTGGVTAQTAPTPVSAGGASLGGTRFDDVASQIGLRFRHGAFRFGMSLDTTAMMGGGLCWLDYDSDGWLDLFVVNSYADVDIGPSDANGGLPRTALFHNVGGRFEDVSSRSGADLPLRGNGCVAADFDLDGHTDLYVTSAGYNVPTDGYDALLWNEGDGTFTEGAVRAGIKAQGWHSAAAAGDVNGDGRPDLFVTSYADPNFVVDSSAGFPSSHAPVRDLLYLNQGHDEGGRSTFREMARAAGIEKTGVGHGLGSVFTDVDGDGRLDLYVANDTDPNQLYRNTATTGGLRLPLRGCRQALRGRRPERGDGRRRCRLQRRRAGRPLRHKFAPPTARRLPEPPLDTRPVHGRSAGHRRRHRHRLDGMGRLMGRPRPRRRPRPRTRERRDSRREPREGRAARSDPRERGWAWQGAPLRAGRGSRARSDASRQRTRPCDGGLRQRRRPRRRGQHDRRQARPAPKRRTEPTLAGGSLPQVCAGSGRDGDARRRAEARPRGAGGLELPLVRGSEGALRARHGDSAVARALAFASRTAPRRASTTSRPTGSSTSASAGG